MPGVKEVFLILVEAR